MTEVIRSWKVLRNIQFLYLKRRKSSKVGSQSSIHGLRDDCSGLIKTGGHHCYVQEIPERLTGSHP
jgi:hypothetical protein